MEKSLLQPLLKSQSPIQSYGSDFVDEKLFSNLVKKTNLNTPTNFKIHSIFVTHFDTIKGLKNSSSDYKRKFNRIWTSQFKFIKWCRIQIYSFWMS